VGASGAAVEIKEGPSDPDLRVLVEWWPDLPAAIRAGIVAMVQAALGGREQHEANGEGNG
jgi:hypothetical protein